MSQLSQKEAVFKAVTSVLSQSGIAFEEGTDAGPYMTRELRGQVNAILFESFQTGVIQLDRKFSDTELKAYVSGLQSNWLRKDARLNGGGKYSPKNPGSRVGGSDPQIKAMRQLFKTLATEEDRAEVQACIDARLVEITPKKSVSIDLSALPENLRNKIN
jgi:hypothetical protein